MTPEEIKEHFGIDALNMLYDNLLDRPVHELADWVLMLYTEKEIGEWIFGLKSDIEGE